jgi:hypothetical protein
MPVINGVYLKDFTALPDAVADANIIPIAISGNQVAYRTTVGGIVTDARVTGKLLTGLSVTGGAIASTDSILTAFGKVQNQLNSKVSSVGLTMPSAFSVANSPITSSGTLAVTANGLASQYIRGDGTLADFPTGGGGGGSSVSYYLNGSVNQGTFGGNVYKEMNKVPVFGAGTDFTISSNGYIAQFLTDANDPNSLLIPAGNWNFETYFSASSGGGSPSFYVQLYKFDGTTFTLIASNSATPELIAFGTTINPYFSALAVPETVLLATDRLAVRIFVNNSGRTITLHTENSHLCQIITTFTTGLQSLNGLSEQAQYFAVGSTGTDFNIASSVDTHTFNIPSASASNRGLITTGTQTIAGEKTFTSLLLGTRANFTSSGSGDTLGINHSSGSGIALYITKAGDGEGIYINKSSGSGNAVTIVGTLNATTLVKNGGTSSQFLKADGSVDSTSYQPLLVNPVTGTGTTNYVPKFTGASTIGNSLIYDNGTAVGIGTTNPNYLFQVKKATNVNFGINLQNAGISLEATNDAITAYIPMTYYASAHYLLDGNVGINTIANAGFRLDVNGTGRYTGQLTLGSTITNGTYTYTLPSATGTLALTSNITSAISGTTNYVPKFTSANVIGNSLIYDNGTNVGIGTTSPGEILHLQATQPVIRYTKTGVLNWKAGIITGNDYAITVDNVATTAFTIQSGTGNVGIGTTSPSYQLQLSTDSAAKPTSALWTIASDERIKENITPYTKGLTDLLKINPINYDYNGLGGFKKGKGGVGIIAQEIIEILPDSVSSIKAKLNENDENEIDILNFNGHELTYVLINAIKEQQQQIEELKALINK